MTHYDITIIGTELNNSALADTFKDKYKVLLVDQSSSSSKCADTSHGHIYTTFSTRYRNTIKTKNGYIVILHKEKKNIQISTDIIIRADEVHNTLNEFTVE